MKQKILSILLSMSLLLAALPALSLAEADNSCVSDEKITLKVWMQIGANQLGNMKDYGESEAWQKIEELTNVHIEWIHPTTGSEKESFNLMFASDDLPDIIVTTKDYQYSAGPEAAVEDGYYLDITDLAMEYAPNYMKILDENPDVAKMSVTDSGLRWGFNWMYKDGKKGNSGLGIRKDFLDRVGMDVPVTYDDWHQVLTAFKDELGVEAPFFLYYKGVSEDSELLAGYGVGRDFYQVDGKVKYGPVEPGYKEYLDMMRTWYAEGLIDHDFALRPSSDPDDDLVLNDKIGAWRTPATWCGGYYITRGATNPDFNLVGVPVPVKNVGDETHIRNVDLKISGWVFAINALTEHPVECVKWLDFLYGETGSFITNYGAREGESYVQQADGTYRWGELITKNPDGMTQNEARTRYTTLNAPYEDYTRVSTAWTPVQAQAQQVWTASKDDWCIPTAVIMLADENKQFASIMADIETYVSEFTIKYIMGVSTVDYDAYLAQVNSMGIDAAIALKQAALDRFNAR